MRAVCRLAVALQRIQQLPSRAERLFCVRRRSARRGDLPRRIPSGLYESGGGAGRAPPVNRWNPARGMPYKIPRLVPGVFPDELRDPSPSPPSPPVEGGEAVGKPSSSVSLSAKQILNGTWKRY